MFFFRFYVMFQCFIYSSVGKGQKLHMSSFAYFLPIERAAQFPFWYKCNCILYFRECFAHMQKWQRPIAMERCAISIIHASYYPHTRHTAWYSFVYASFVPSDISFPLPPSSSRFSALLISRRGRRSDGWIIEDFKLLRRGRARERKEGMPPPPFPPLRWATGGNRA